MSRISFLAAACALLASCSGTTNPIYSATDPLITVLSRVANTAGTDLTVAENVANAATPKDTDGFTCDAALLTVQGQISAVVTAAHVPTAGVFATAELASLFQPGSQQYNQAKQLIVSGCAAKAQDVMGPTALLGSGVLGALAVGQQIAPLAAAIP